MMDPDWRSRHCAEPAVETASNASGRDIWAELGGCPRSWREAAALYRRLGVRTLEDAVTKVLGAPVDRRLARRGDVVMVRGALGVCHGEVAVFMDATVRMREVELAWRSDAAVDRAPHAAVEAVSSANLDAGSAVFGSEGDSQEDLSKGSID